MAGQRQREGHLRVDDPSALVNSKVGSYLGSPGLAEIWRGPLTLRTGYPKQQSTGVKGG